MFRQFLKGVREHAAAMAVDVFYEQDADVQFGTPEARRILDRAYRRHLVRCFFEHLYQATLAPFVCRVVGHDEVVHEDERHVVSACQRCGRVHEGWW